MKLKYTTYSKLNNAILLIWVYFVALAFARDISIVGFRRIDAIDTLSFLLQCLLIVLVAIKLFIEKHNVWGYLIPTVTFLLLLFLQQFFDNGVSALLFLFVIGFYGIEYERIVKLYALVVGFGFIVSTILTLCGYVGMRTSDGGRFSETRISLGAVNPNSCGAIILLLFCAWIFVFDKGQRVILKSAVAELICCILFYYVQSLSFFAITTIGLTVIIIGELVKKSSRLNWIFSKIIMGVIAFGPTLIVIGSIVGGMIFEKFGPLSPQGLLGTLISRMNFVGMAFRKYPITLFGTDIPYMNLGTKEIIHGDMFLLDNGWMSILFSKGIVFLLVFLLLLQIPAFISYKRNEFRISIIFFMFAAEVFMESCLQDVVYGPIWCAFFSLYPINIGECGSRNEAVKE